MISGIWNTLIYEPLYNGFIFLADLLPWADLGLIIILFTIIIKFILFPLSLKSVRTQQSMKKIQPEIDAIKKKHKDDKQQQAIETMDLYKKYGIKPFSGIFLVFIQIPIVFGLYFIFLKGGFPEIKADILYPFVKVPELIKLKFLGIADITQKSLVLALMTGITQFLHSQISLGKDEKTNKNKKNKQPNSMKDDFMKTLKLQMRYGLPVLITFIAYSLSGAIALYWTTSNIFHIVQELYVKKMLKKEDEPDDLVIEAEHISV
ncbi:hypothetical protein COW81_00220 [Candidatus Campbellbacteria bacterium CG22_combo_CG10-13_8_21_14_all_36_13]|uniref:Membrane insertase YidC/Oxa/ALB C-terminal domain-containing protein n=1 Tax=Candidatus Campbellbacteria bacterium CG22_combo_CG10-13_8_21_14_all_36_13 TaxID=1974529 RepID=A0A2H0DZ36_9BACT|nr:MAG: hypothetical protein COW81_00220 [Candidatus Campbellbacteria bacterium CG22_combo_CG10-13_8_21_14_all_36_13]